MVVLCPKLAPGIARTMVLFLCCGLLLFQGCERPNYSVRGTVTLDGKPLSDARVSFLPLSAEGTPAMAITQPDGQYVLEQAFETSGAAIGEYEVTISTYRDADQTDPEAQPGVPERVPERYNIHSELQANIEAAENVFDFALESR